MSLPAHTTGSRPPGGPSQHLFLVAEAQGQEPRDAVAGRMLGDLEKTVGLLEQVCVEPAAREPNPKRFAMHRAHARAVLAQLDMLVTAADADQWNPSEDQRRRIEGVRDRADELVDTFGWSADAADDLASLAEAECT